MTASLRATATAAFRRPFRLAERGRLIQPEGGARLAREIAAESNPWEAFIEEQCVVEEGEYVTCSDLYGRFEWWCNENGRLDLLKRVPTPQLFGKKLKKEVETIRNLLNETFRPSDSKRQYLGSSGKPICFLVGVVRSFAPSSIGAGGKSRRRWDITDARQADS